MNNQVVLNVDLKKALLPFVEAYNQGRLAFLVGAGRIVGCTCLLSPS